MSSSDTKDTKNVFQNTLNLPTTDFSIRANAHEKEPEILERWEQDQLYEKATHLNKGGERYILHDGPPYANGPIHLGTAFNKTLKDISTKSRRMAGFHVPFVPGWDCHGLPIELKVANEHKGEPLTPAQLKELCRKYAQHWIDYQREDFKNIGVIADWKHYYSTMHPTYEAHILEAFATFVEKGYIERKGKTVPWCFSCQTVLATAEIEYKDRKDPSCYVLFEMKRQIAQKTFPFIYEQKPDLKLYCLIWTTTPWTLPLNRAVVLHPTATYVVLEGKEPNQGIIVAKDLAEKLCQTLGLEHKELCEFDPDTLKGKYVAHPFVDGLEVSIIFDDSVLLSEGTACVHCAPGCGPEDYIMAIKNGIEIYSPLSPDGKYTKEIAPAELSGMSITDGQIWALKKMTEKGILFHKTNINHSYPHCWRCRNGLMFRATDQWFCDLQKHDLAKEAVKQIETMEFIPVWGKTRLQAFIENRTEWCISRQRVWGVPITSIICNACEHAYLNADMIRNIAKKVAQFGVEYWDRVTLDELVQEGFIASPFICSSCGNSDLKKFRKEYDILDVWFDSGASSYAVLAQHKELTLPVDLYLEGSDQHRGWFQSSLLCSQVVNGKSPMKTILTHGYIVDEKYHKMSKSLGNVVAPQDMVKKYSRDILRLWVASTDFEGDVVISEKLMQNVAEMYRKIRNTCRFLISNLYDFDIKRDGVDIKNLLKIDQYILAELHSLSEKILESYKHYHFSRVVQLLNNFCTKDLSALYLDVCKDRLYVEKSDSHLRRSAQTAIYHILDALTHLMAPVLSFLAEELGDHYLKDKKESVHLARFPEVANVWENLVEKQDFPRSLHHGLADKHQYQVLKTLTTHAAWTLLTELRDVVLKSLEEKRQAGVIKHSLEAQVTLHLNLHHDKLQVLGQFINEIKASEDLTRFFKDWFIVSQVHLVDTHDGLTQTALPWAWVKAEHAAGVKCPRCWQWDAQVSVATMKAHCEVHKEHHQAEINVHCVCKEVAPQELLCTRCRAIIL